MRNTKLTISEHAFANYAHTHVPFALGAINPSKNSLPSALQQNYYIIV